MLLIGSLFVLPLQRFFAAAAFFFSLLTEATRSEIFARSAFFLDGRKKRKGRRRLK